MIIDKHKQILILNFPRYVPIIDGKILKSIRQFVCFSCSTSAKTHLGESSPKISSRSLVDWTSSRLAREASSFANYLAREFHLVGMCTHTTVSPTRRYGDQVEGKKRRRRRSAHEREEKGRKIRERRAAERLARRATIKIARSNRRAWCSFDVLYLSVILLSFPTPTGHGDIHAERTPP